MMNQFEQDVINRATVKLASTAVSRYLAKNPEKATVILDAMRAGKINSKEMTLKHLGTGGSQKAELVLVPDLGGLAVRKHFSSIYPGYDEDSKSTDLLAELTKPEYTEVSRYLGGRGNYANILKNISDVDTSIPPIRYFEYVPGKTQKEFPMHLADKVNNTRKRARGILRVIRATDKNDKSNDALLDNLEAAYESATKEQESAEKAYYKAKATFGSSAYITPELRQQIDKMEQNIGAKLTDYRRPTNIINNKLIDVDTYDEFMHIHNSRLGNQNKLIFESGALQEPILVPNPSFIAKSPSTIPKSPSTIPNKKLELNLEDVLRKPVTLPISTVSPITNEIYTETPFKTTPNLLNNVALVSALALGGYGAYKLYNKYSGEQQ